MVKSFGHTPRVFKKFLYISMVAHLLVIIVLGIYMRGKRKVFFTPVYTVSLVEPPRERKKQGRKKSRQSITTRKKRRATKKTAKKTLVLKKKKAAPRPKKHVEKEISEALSAIRRKVQSEEEQKALAARIEAIRKRQEAEALMKRLESIKKTLDAPPPARTVAKRRATPLLTPTGGLRTESLELKHKAYFALIRDRVQANWIYPENFDNEKISVIVSIRIGRDGTLLKSWVEKGSGNRQFDESLLKAVRKASPFPPLPEDFTEDTLETGLRFCPTCD